MRVVATREDIRRAAGHALIIGFEGTQVTAELRELLREIKPLGLILFSRNIESPEQTAELIRELKTTYAGERLLITVDQEGGRVARVGPPATQWPPMRLLGDIDQPALTERVGRALGREMRALGFDVTFAPVLDVDTNPKNPVIGDRSFSRSAEIVAKHGVALIRGLREAGVSGCGKHFPGHGDTDVDSHLALPVVEQELPRLQEVEWLPFRAAINAGVSAIMTAHVMLPCLDDDVPATLSQPVLARLRSELGFGGVVISDDLEMKAVWNHFTPSQMATHGLNAGINVFLACKDPAFVMNMYRAIVQAAEQERVAHKTLLDAEKRTQTWVERFYRPCPPSHAVRLEWVGCAEHSDLLAEIDAYSRAGS